MSKDLEMIVSRIKQLHLIVGQSTQLPSIVQDVLDSYIPLSRRAAAEEPRESFFDWNDIGGLYKAKNALVELVVCPMRFQRI